MKRQLDRNTLMYILAGVVLLAGIAAVVLIVVQKTKPIPVDTGYTGSTAGTRTVTADTDAVAVPTGTATQELPPTVSGGKPSAVTQRATSTRSRQTTKPKNIPTGTAATTAKPSAGKEQPTAAPSRTAAAGIPYIVKGLAARYDFEDAANMGKDASGKGHDLAIWKTGNGTIRQTDNDLDSKLGKAALFDGHALLAAGTVEQSKGGYTDFVDALKGSYTLTFFAKNIQTSATAAETHRNLFCNGYWNSPASPYLEMAFTFSKDGDWNNFASYLNYGAVMNGLNFRKFAWQADNGTFYDYGKLDTKWYHYAVVVDTAKVQVDMYIDGKLIKSNAPGTQSLATQSTETPFSIGGMAVPGENPVVRDGLVGAIDDFRVYERALSVYEIGTIQKRKG